MTRICYRFLESKSGKTLFTDNYSPITVHRLLFTITVHCSLFTFIVHSTFTPKFYLFKGVCSLSLRHNCFFRTSSSTPTARTISKNEIVSNENIDSNTVSSISAKNIFDDDLPEIKKFDGNSKPMSFTKNWYSKFTPPDMQFEERSFKHSFLFLLINFMNGILIICLNKKSLIK